MTLTAIKNEFEKQILSESAETITVRPKDLTGAATLVRHAAENDCKVVPVGGGTKRHWTDAPAGPTVELHMRSCCRVVEYSPEDMTITVEAGIVLAELAAVLAPHNQRISLDPPLGTRATIGGVLAANDSGPVRLAWGTARDIVIGMQSIDPHGELIHSGGKVVKNVAGYDLHKLHIGAFGTLGPIATATFRLRPLPECRGLVLLQPHGTDAAERMLAAILAGPTRPTMLELVNARMAQALDLPPRLTLVVGFEDNAEAVRWQCDQIRKDSAAQSPATADILDRAASDALYEKLREAPATAGFRAAMLSSATSGFMAAAERLCPDIRTIAHAGSGIVYGLFEKPEAVSAAAWKHLEKLTVESGGSLHIRGPLPTPEWARFGRPRSDAHLSKAIQKAFDPKATFAPERVSYLR